jgi:hypothetical protein
MALHALVGCHSMRKIIRCHCDSFVEVSWAFHSTREATILLHKCCKSQSRATQRQEVCTTEANSGDHGEWLCPELPLQTPCGAYIMLLVVVECPLIA